MSDDTTDTCPHCGMPTETDALRFLHERYHEDSVLSNRTKYVPFAALRALSEIMQDYADWCFAQMDGSADDGSEG